MVHKLEERVDSPIKGTIIDFETIGGFDDDYDSLDSRHYKDIRAVIFGYLSKDLLRIYCAKGVDSLQKIEEIMAGELKGLDKPFYAFNCNFERSVIFHTLSLDIPFEGELGRELPDGRHEAKRFVVSKLGIPQYGDPFNDVGKECMMAWERGDLEKAIAHNRSCLLKERDILLKRGPRTPDGLKLIKATSE